MFKCSAGLDNQKGQGPTALHADSVYHAIGTAKSALVLISVLMETVKDYEVASIGLYGMGDCDIKTRVHETSIVPILANNHQSLHQSSLENFKQLRMAQDETLVIVILFSRVSVQDWKACKHWVDQDDAQVTMQAEALQWNSCSLRMKVLLAPQREKDFRSVCDEGVQLGFEVIG
ncbi:hypothetical protein VNO78_32099 [Psophocarpus tetragonolobus]|uniref:Uncharacterized protein n=1 Tax=Psophocarpus tetragonolobus TaxID=3891 RepID=A0AAN9X981_PSOTE